jgi:hypothetical protein
MTRYGRSAWQVIAVAAFVATAAVAVTLTRPEPTAVTEFTAACRVAGLDAWLGIAASAGDPGRPSGRAPGPAPGTATGVGRTAEYYALEFTNISRQACSLYGYPGVWAYTGGRQVGSPATLDTSVRPSTVTLAPGATAHAVLRYTAGSSPAGCKQVIVRELRVKLPQAGGEVLVPLTLSECPSGKPSSLSVQAVQPRAGIPGLMHE